MPESSVTQVGNWKERPTEMWAFLFNRKEVDTMEELQKALVAKIGEQLDATGHNIQYLDVLNRLLGTVNNFLLNKGGK